VILANLFIEFWETKLKYTIQYLASYIVRKPLIFSWKMKFVVPMYFQRELWTKIVRKKTNTVSSYPRTMSQDLHIRFWKYNSNLASPWSVIDWFRSLRANIGYKKANIYRLWEWTLNIKRRSGKDLQHGLSLKLLWISFWSKNI
jgi:hypothetical protein